MPSTNFVRAWGFELPAWVADAVAAQPPPYADDAAAMGLAIALSRGAYEHGDGGPFGAVVIDAGSGELVAPGVNLVFRANAAIAHAEIVALTLAQRATGLEDLGERPDLLLATSGEPCAMCLGALPWTGIRRVVIGAREADISAAGFDEGAKPPGWVEALAARGIGVVRDIKRDEAAAVLRDYARQQGRIYGTGRG